MKNYNILYIVLVEVYYQWQHVMQRITDIGVPG
jgi:hypothetical protein